MFVNVNTKGKPLEMIEILKSQLFKSVGHQFYYILYLFRTVKGGKGIWKIN